MHGHLNVKLSGYLSTEMLQLWINVRSIGLQVSLLIKLLCTSQHAPAVNTTCNTIKYNAMTSTKLLLFILIEERIFCFQEILHLRQMLAAL